MATTRSKHRAMGTAAPELSTLSSITAQPAGKARHRVTIEEIPDVSLGHTRDDSSDMDIPGSFASSPVNLGKAPAEPEPEPELDSDEIDARIAATHISIAPEECTDVESCPSDGSIAPEDFWSEVDPPAASTSRKPYPAERTAKPSEYPTPGETTWRAYGQSTTPYKTPSRHAKIAAKTPSIRLGGPLYFPHNTTIYNVPEAPSESPVNSAEQKSDETLKQEAEKPKSQRQLRIEQRARDMEFLREIIQDKKRLKRMQKVMPDLVPNNKPLLNEVMDRQEESSGAEGHESSVWEDEVYGIPSNSPPVQTWEIMTSEPKTQSPVPGPSYFDKGKWVSSEDYEANRDYITAHKPAPTASSEGRKKKKKSKSKKPRPSLGINLEQIRPTQGTIPSQEKTRDAVDLKASIAALPAGGYFAEKMRAKSIAPDQSRVERPRQKFNPLSDSSDSTSESSESSSEQSSTSSPDSSDSENERRKRRKKKSSKGKSRSEYREENRELKEKVKKAQRASVKLKEPTTYFGQENYNEFELWSYETDQWIKASGFSDADAVEYMGTFLKKKAGRWYIDHVIPNLDEWTVDSLKMGLFAYCFPTDLKSQLRDEFDAAKQENQKFVDYLQTLKRLQRRIPDITNRQICIKLWKTVHEYIKIRWIENGMDGETTDLRILSEAAERYEAAERVKRKNEGFRYPPKPKYIPVQSEPKTEGRKPFSSAPKKPDNANSKPQGESSKGHSKNGKNRDQKPKPRSDKPKMSREERNELRAAGKCFVCKETGHTVKDCPTRNTAKPASVFSAAVQLKHDLIDELRKQREQPCIDIASIQLGTNDPSTDESGDTSYGTCVSEITPADTLLNEIMAAVTPYSQIVVADNDRFRITNRDLVTVEMTYADIAKQVRETYLYENDERTRIELENNQGHNRLPDIPEEGESRIESGSEWELLYWSDSDDEETQKPVGTGTLGRDLSTNLSETTPTPERHWDLSTQLAAMRLDKKHGESSTRNIERNASRPKDITRKLPKPLVVQATINGKEVRALIDTGSLGDFISTTAVDQLKLEREALAKPIGLQMAVAGSRSSINFSVTARLGYQGIDESRRFDVINLDNYDLILGTPFLYQYGVILSFSPPTVSIGCTKARPIQRDNSLVIESLATELYEEAIEERREALRKYSADLCKSMAETPLPPFRAINHTIPIIDPTKKYHTRRVQCPKPLKEQFDEKFSAYLNTGRWEFRPGINAIPMLIMMKKSKDRKTAVRTVLDKREINANTHKLASPLPDIEEILSEVARHPYRSLIDGKDAYEQIRVVPEDVEKTLFMTPNGTMVSKIMQQGDCNAGATYQALMNHIFADYIGKFMFVYLDDIIIFSDSAQEHEKHIRMVFDVLRKEKLYLSPHKMQLFADKLEILGHVVTSEGIKMDPHKVDAVEKWIVPKTKEQIMSFLGAVGYLAPNCAGVRIPMGVLSKRASATQPWRWEAAEQRAFDEIKQIVSEHREVNRKPLDYSLSELS